MHGSCNVCNKTFPIVRNVLTYVLPHDKSGKVVCDQCYSELIQQTNDDGGFPGEQEINDAYDDQ